MEKYMEAAGRAVSQCLNIKPGEKVQIITDTHMLMDISNALFYASKEKGAEAELKVMKPLSRDGEEPPKEIAELMKTPDVLFLVTSRSLTHTKARREASEKGVRIASMPNISDLSFTEGGLTADYQVVKRLTHEMYEKVKNAKNVRLTSKNGTDVRMKVEGRRWILDDGFFHEDGEYGNLPAGEVFVAPVENTSEGIIYIDKMGKWRNIKLVVKKGYASEIECHNDLKKIIDDLGKKARNIAELGIGTNPKAKVIGNVLEDEKALGTVHVALGNNAFFGGEVDVPFHKDGVILKPTLEVDGEIIIKEGVWVIENEAVNFVPMKEKKKPFPEKKEKPEDKEDEQITSNSYQDFNPYVFQKLLNYNKYVKIRYLEGHYFPPGVLGMTRCNGEALLRPDLYGEMRHMVRVHEIKHNHHPYASEGAIRASTSHYLNTHHINSPYN